MTSTTWRWAATATGEATATLTQAQIDAGSVTNIADVTGDDPNGDPVTDSDTNTVSIDQNPAIDLVKTNGGVVDEDGNGDDAGDTIVYDYSVDEHRQRDAVQCHAER